MSADKTDHALESRLRKEASQLAPRDLPSDIAATLWTTHQALQRRKRRQASFGATVVLVILGVLLGPRLFSERDVRPPVAEQKVNVAPQISQAPQTPNQDAVSTAANSNTSFAESSLPAYPGALPVFVSLRDENGKQIVLPGLYVPRSIERIDAAQLAPAERRAVQRLLGVEEAAPLDSV